MRTLPFNLTGHPALSLPAGLSGGLPLGVQIIGRAGDEATVCRAGHALESAFLQGCSDLSFKSDT
jgi:aspartyl-tRNA(Asn)/glutamyl-tRNA(Gln) amidotransferase subunit A